MLERLPCLRHLFALVVAALPAVAGATETPLYEAQTIVTGERPETRGPGLVECLEAVLVKVSGDGRLIGDPRVAALAPNVTSFVRDFRYHDRMSGIPHHDEQGTRDRPYDLIVTFDPGRINDALRAIGRTPWTDERPRLAVFLGMRNLTTSFTLASDGERALERQALLEAAATRGVPIVLPDSRTMAAAGLRFETIEFADPAALEEAATAAGAQLALVGRMAWSNEALAWIADWRLRTAGKTHRWQVKSVTFDDGFRKAISGASLILSGNGP